MDLEDGEVEDEGPSLASDPVSWSSGPQSHVAHTSGNCPLLCYYVSFSAPSSDFSFLFGHQDIDLRALTHAPVPPPLQQPADRIPGGSGVFCYDGVRAVDTDARIPYHLLPGLPAALFPVPAHIPLQSLDPNLSLPLHSVTSFTHAHVPFCSQPLLVDLTTDSSPPRTADKISGTRRRISGVREAAAMKQELDQQPPISPYEPNDSTFVPISRPDSNSSVAICDETAVVDDWLEKALDQNIGESGAIGLGANSGTRGKSEQTTSKVTVSNSHMGTSMSNASSKRKRSRSPSDSRSKMRMSENSGPHRYRYKDITVIDHRRLSDSKPPVRRDSTKSLPSTPKSGSRRVAKRHEARKVHSVRKSVSDAVPADPLLPDDMKDAPIEVLMAHVERIKNELLALSETENQVAITPSPSPDQLAVSKIPSSDSKRGSTEDEDDEDIGELRRIAILSMKAKALEDSAAVTSQTGNLQPEERLSVQNDDDDVDMLRQQLLISLNQNRQKRAEPAVQPIIAAPLLAIQDKVPHSSASKSAISDAASSRVNRLVINFNNSDSDSDDDQPAKAEPPGLMSLLAAARSQSDQKQVQEQLPLAIQKLTFEQQMEYIRLKKEIAKREKKVDTTTMQLAANEKRYQQLIQSAKQKELKVESIKDSVAKKKVQYLKADAHCKKMAELHAAAETMVNQTKRELERLTVEQTQSQKDLVAEKAEVRALDQECLRLGKEVRGASYVQPSKRPVDPLPLKSRPNAEIEAEKNRLIARKSAIESLVQKKRRSVQIRPKRKPNPAVVRKIPALHALKKSNIVKNGRENKDPQILKTKKKRKPPAKEENFERSVALLFDRHLKETAKEQESGTAAIDYLIERPEIRITPTDCVLRGMSSFRLSSAFSKVESRSVISDSYCNAIDPFRVICYFDLHGVCKDPKCEQQHRTQYLLDDTEKLVDIVAYNPSVAGVTDPSLLDKGSLKQKLSDFVERYAASQPSQTADTIAKQLIKLIRHSRVGDKTELSRVLRPALTHQPAFDVRRFKYAFNGELNSDGTEVSHESSDVDDNF